MNRRVKFMFTDIFGTYSIFTLDIEDGTSDIPRMVNILRRGGCSCIQFREVK